MLRNQLKIKMNPVMNCAKYLMLVPLLVLAAPEAFAQDALNPGNTSWLLTSTALVLFMTIPGVSLFYAGLVRSKNVLSVLMQCFSIACIVTIVWLVAGYSLAFDDLGQGVIGGLGKMFFAGVLNDSMAGDVPESAFALFQLTFAIISVALIVGGLAERIQYGAVVLFAILWVVFVYCPVAHWVWGGGWLGAMGVLDFAGGNVVHITAGVSALVGAILLGKRKGFPKIHFTPHNMTLVMIGASILWVGWFGFNGGSAVAANTDAAMAMLVTQICAATTALSFGMAEYMSKRSASALGVATGAVAGLVAITPASGFVGPAGALAIGIITGPVSYFGIVLIKHRLNIDDTLDVFPIHAIAGVVGTVLTGVFASSQLGIFSGQGIEFSIGYQVWIQIVGAVATIVYTAVVTFIIFKVIGLMVKLRVDDESEVMGLDLATHEERGYDL